MLKISTRHLALATTLLAAAAAVAQTQTAPKRDLSKGNTLYVVPYAHLDTQWRWAYPQVISEFIANTLHKNFELIDKYPHYIFNFSGSRRYEFMRDYYPADFERLKGYIKAGRWFPAGSSVDEGDANVPSAESLVRHTLYGNRFFRKNFGVASREFMLPDCFGFPYALPTIMAHCGIIGFSTQKLTWGSAVGIPFKVGTWEGPDGKSLIAALDPGSYSGDVDEDLSANTSWLARIQNTGKQSGAFVDYHYYGTGDVGGGPHDDSVAWVEQSIVNGKGPINVVSSHSEDMFLNITPEQRAKLPHYKGELLLTQHSAGSITSEGYMKRWNRKNELLADGAERASVTASWLGGTPYPSDRLYNAWDLVLGSQMHDMLPGTSIPKAYEFCWNDELLAQNQFASIEQDGVGAVASAMNTKAQGQAIVVYNPLSTSREDVVEAMIPPITTDNVQVYGPTGETVPTQVLSKTDKGVDILFLAKAPSVGFTVYDARPTQHSVQESELSVKSDRILENQIYRVTINDEGDISSVFDKAVNQEILKSPSQLVFQHENPSQFPAWNMDWDDAKLPPDDHVHGPAKIKVIENGPVRVAIEVERETDGSKFVQDIRLSSGGAGNKIEVANKIDWQTREHALKASFPLTCANPMATYDLQVGAIQRGNNNEKKYEVPQHQWLDLSKPDGDYGVGILNEGKYGSDKPDDNTVRLTMIYTPGTRGGYSDQATQDFGRHDILYAIQPHAGDWNQVPWAAKRFNQPLRAFLVPSHDGKLGRELSLISCDTAQVEISAIKKAEDGNEVVVRLRELDGIPAKHVHLIAMNGIVSAREVNGQELPLGPATVHDGVLDTDVPAFSLRAFALKLGNAPVKAAQTQSTPVQLAYDTDAASTAKNPKDGSFNNKGETLSAEQLPGKLTVSGIDFQLGPTAEGAKNAISARGQTINLPAGSSRVYIIAASSNGDVPATFKVGDRQYPVTIQSWDGYVGQWDNRLWNPDLGVNYTNYAEWQGLTPGYVKPAEVAWFCNHKHDPATGNEFYQYSYLYKYGFDVPAGATTLTLPVDPSIKVLAVSVAKNQHDSALAAMPLYDRLADHQGIGAPVVSAPSGSYSDATPVSIQPPLYWEKGGLRYTTDGSDPTASSPAYDASLMVYHPTTIKVAEFDANGVSGPVATAVLDVKDTTPPHLVAASSAKVLGVARVQFSEPVDQTTAENPSNYSFTSGAKVSEAKLLPDARSVELTLDKSLPAGQTETLIAHGVKDPAGNASANSPITIEERGAVFTGPDGESTKTQEFRVNGLPVKAKDSWTLNLFCKPDSTPENLTLIAGFGRDVDGRNGTGRYFAKFQKGINFWVCDEDVLTDTQLDIGKWQMLTATFDGETIRLYKNGEKIAEEADTLSDDRPAVELLPVDAWEQKRVFPGSVKNLTIWNEAISPVAVKRLWEAGQKG